MPAQCPRRLTALLQAPSPTSSAARLSLDLRASPWRDDQTQPALLLAAGAGPFVSAYVPAPPPPAARSVELWPLYDVLASADRKLYSRVTYCHPGLF